MLPLLLCVCSSDKGQGAPSLPAISSASGTVSWSIANDTIALKNDVIELRLDASTGALIGLTSLVTGTEFLNGDHTGAFLAAIDSSTADVFSARAVLPATRQATTLSQLNATLAVGSVTFDLTYAPMSGVIVVQHVTIADHDPVAHWTTDVTPAPNTTVTAISSPVLLGVQGLDGEQLAWPWHEGLIFEQPGNALQEMGYPVPAGAQWMELYSGTEGLYTATLDPSGAYKEMRFGSDPGGNLPGNPRQMTFSFYPFATSAATYTTPPVQIGVAPEGNWYWGADRYKAFLKSANMVRALSKTASEFTGWHKGYDRTARTTYDYCSIPNLVMPADYSAKTGLTTLLMYGWHYDGLDSYFPDYDFLSKNAPNPACLNGSDLAASLSTLATRPTPNRVMFYINGHIADVASDWMQDPTNAACSAKDPNGNPYVEHYTNLPENMPRTFQAMCPSAAAWQNQLYSKAMQLRNLAPKGQGAAGVYWDQVEEMPSVLCFDRTHGHATPATAFSEGYKSLYTRLQQDYSFGGTTFDYIFAAEGANDFYSQFIDLPAGMPDRTFGYQTTTCAPYGYPCGATHAPELGRYTFGVRFLGLANFGAHLNETDEFSRAFLMGDPIKTMEIGGAGTNLSDPYATSNSPVVLRYTNIYRTEPSIYFYGTYLDHNGLTLSVDAATVLGTMIISADKSSLAVQLWNETASNLSVDVTIDESRAGLLGTAFVATDLDGGKAPSITLAGNTLKFSVTVSAHDVRAIKVGAADNNAPREPRQRR